MFRIVLLLLVFVLAACGGLGGEPRIVATLPPATTLPDDVRHPVVPPDIALGASLFAQHCTDCHGIGGVGDGELVLSGQVPAPPDFTNPDTARVVRPVEWFEIVTNGRIENLMPPWKGTLTEEERWAVTLYVYTMAYTQAQLAEGRDLYAAECAECHGDTGTGDGERAGEINRPIGDLTDQVELAALPDSALFTIITEGQGQMPAYEDDLTDEQRWAVTAFTRSLSLANTDAIDAPQADATPDPEATADLTTGTITGTLTNGTAGGSIPTDFALTLYAIRETDAGRESETYATTADASGAYAFADVLIDPERSYIISALYRERIVTSALVPGSDLAASPVLPLTIYELTEDPTVITITSMDTQIDAAGDGLQVLQEIVFTNSSDRLYTNSLQIEGSAFASVVVGLPPGAVSIAFPDDASRYILAEDSTVVVDTIPVVPGDDHSIHLSYFIPYGEGAVIEQPVYYNTAGTMRVLVFPPSLTVTSEQLAPEAPQTFQGRAYQVVAGSPALAPGDAVRFELSGSASAVALAAAPASSNSSAILALIGVIAVGIIGVLFYIYMQQGKAARALPNRQLLIDGLIRQIAELDNEHDAGRIDDAAYQRERAALKSRLAQLMDEPTP